MKLCTILLCAVALHLVVGCSKKEETSPPAAADPASGSPTTAPAPAAVATPGQVTPASAPDPSAALAQAAAALKAKEYERAVQVMLTIQSASLSEQQAQVARNQMARLQSDLAAAVARGDASARAAADLLRRSASGDR